MKILHIDSSPSGPMSVTRRYSAEVVQKLCDKYPDATVITRDLVEDPLRLVDAPMVGAMFMPPEAQTKENHAAIEGSDAATVELLETDILVIGAPMHNFTVPAVLKTWIDSVVRMGRTFKYTEKGIEGLVPPGKKAYLVLSRGGIYGDGPAKDFDFQEPYLRAILGAIGITDTVVIAAEGTNLGPDMMAAMHTSVADQISATVH